jgi:urease accessory protein
MEEPMAELPIAQTLHRAGTWSGPAAACALDYAGRFVRRKRLHTTDGMAFLLDLPQTTSLDHGDAVVLTDGGLVQIVAADEALLRVTGADLPRIAWHIGNRHTPCQIAKGHLLIRDDPVIAHMLRHVGAEVTPMTGPFTPEGGAYGMGRTHDHDHGHSAHDPHSHHPHAQSHDHRT